MTSQLKTFFLLALLSGLILFLGQALGGPSGLLVALAFALLMNLGSYWYSDKIVLRMYKARELSPSEAPFVHRLVEELAAKAGIPKPRICIVPDAAPNAFATGRNPEHAVVAVTEGLVRLLDANELRGVLAHEISHIAHRDILVQSVAGVLASVVMFIANILQWGALFGAGRGEGNRSGAASALLLALLAPLAATLIQMAISRSREFMADASGAEISGRPADLASALRKLTDYSKQIPLSEGNPATAHMFIVNPFSGKLGSLFSTHPPVDERIRRLLEMSRSG
ncbi:MAG: zinc metalloprotease HtpX [Deltaproteobacteria bacterium]|jgi:heat shock protein HtpX|nr:zinc metalloprotease HtpX [Deltaproteobacteria bacterium]